MSLTATMDAMLAAGCTAEQLAAVVKSHYAELDRIASLPPWAAQVKAVFVRDGRTCRYCGETEGPFEVDHVIPRSKGGTNELTNLVVSCRTCNRSKKDKDVDEFRTTAAARQAHYRARKSKKDSEEIASAGVTVHNGGVTVASPDVTSGNGVTQKRDGGVSLEVSPKENNQTPFLDPSPNCETGARQNRLTGPELVAKADEFYDIYPKKVDPTDAKSRFIRLVKSGADPDLIIAAAKRFAEAHRLAGTDKQFIRAPAVWLNKGSYLSDDLPEASRGPPRAQGPPRRDGRLSPMMNAYKELYNECPDANEETAGEPSWPDASGGGGSVVGRVGGAR